jgi:hypothetical protein|tara:strand:+ start:1107 stop:1478 length:372 start_codon:yes stop_codon:yes gene_type:complete
MSEYMLSDEYAIDDVNPFVQHDFSLPGGVRQTGDFSGFQEVTSHTDLDHQEKSVFCETNACKSETEPCMIVKNIHPMRNIDTGFTCKDKKRLTVGISNKSRMSYIGLFFIIFFITLMIIYARY